MWVKSSLLEVYLTPSEIRRLSLFLRDFKKSAKNARDVERIQQAYRIEHSLASAQLLSIELSPVSDGTKTATALFHYADVHLIEDVLGE
jgi:hypothetical protein